LPHIVGRKIASKNPVFFIIGISIKYDATGLASGIYYYQLQAHSKKITNRNNYTNIKKMLLIR